MKQIRAIVIAAVFLLSAVSSAEANDRSRTKRPTLYVSSQAVVSGQQIKLGDLSVIKQTDKSQSQLVEKLKQVVLAESPAPRASATLLGTNILRSIEDAGFSKSDIGYSIPRAVTVTRDGRVVTKTQVLSRLKEQLRAQGSGEVRVQDLRWPHDYIVPTGDLNISVEQLGKPSGGRLPVRVALTVDSEVSARFLTHAMVDHWGDVPVIGRNLERGMLIAPEDIKIVRVNLNSQPTGVVEEFEDLIGRRVTSRIQAGEPVRANQIDIPPTVERGAVVTMIFRGNGIEATATGKALADGLKGETIVVQNLKSKRIIRATILSPQEVEVQKR